VEIAVLDACVLFRGGVRDFLLWIAEAGAFSPAWSNMIHEEWMRSRRDKYCDPASRLSYARSQMEQAFPGASFDPEPATLNMLSLPDMNDVHVVATAVAAEAQTIITYNVGHFPHQALAAIGLRAETPDAFVSRLILVAQAEIVEGARLHRASLKSPAYDASAYLEHLASQQLVQIADVLKALRQLI
jgi:PIN domain-containing protein